MLWICNELACRRTTQTILEHFFEQRTRASFARLRMHAHTISTRADGYCRTSMQVDEWTLFRKLHVIDVGGDVRLRLHVRLRPSYVIAHRQEAAICVLQFLASKYISRVSLPSLTFQLLNDNSSTTNSKYALSCPPLHRRWTCGGALAVSLFACRRFCLDACLPLSFEAGSSAHAICHRPASSACSSTFNYHTAPPVLLSPSPP